MQSQCSPLKPTQIPDTSQKKNSEIVLEESFKLVVRKIGDNCQAYFHLGLLNLRRSEFSQASQNFQSALNHSNTNSYTVLNHHLCLCSPEQYNFPLDDNSLSIGQESYYKFLREDNTQKNVWNNLSEMYLRGERYQGSQELYESLIQSFPDYLDALSNLGLTYFHQNNINEANACFQSVLKKDPYHLETLNNYSILLIDQHNYKEAVKVLERSINIERKQGFVWNNLGVAFNALSRFEDSLIAFRKAHTLSPSLLVPCLFNESISLLRQGRNEQSFQILKYLNSIDNSLPISQAFSTLSVQLESDLNSMYKRIKETPTVSCHLLNNLGNLLRQSKKYEEAEYLYELCINNHPDFVLAYNNLAILYICKGQEYWLKAKDLLEIAISKDNTFTAALSNKIKLTHMIRLNPSQTYDVHSSLNHSSSSSSSSSFSDLSFGNSLQDSIDLTISQLIRQDSKLSLNEEGNTISHNTTHESKQENKEEDSGDGELNDELQFLETTSTQQNQDSQQTTNEEDQTETFFDELQNDFPGLQTPQEPFS